ncbi:hypothetical protein H7U05_29690 [Priestia megaterium]|uniref:hypothetical protein n=1 Tax=Priestia megaterium TaxID=1404 RepID=UPI001C8D7057|nr:hypothetical protein [Priestia megaterium]MBY0201396.1 hypothetical protein [Priestia megaterium]
MNENLYSIINTKEAKLVLSQGEDNFKEVFERKGQHLYITSFSYNLPQSYNEIIEEHLEFVNDIIVVFNVAAWEYNDDQKINNLITRSLNQNPYIQFFYNTNNHSKIISNGEKMYIGSANATDHTKNNLEAGVIIDDKDAIKKVESKIFGTPYLTYQPIFTDPIAPLLAPFSLLLDKIDFEYLVIKRILDGSSKHRYITEEDLPNSMKDIETELQSYLTTFQLAKEKLSEYGQKIDEFFIIEGLLKCIEDALESLLNNDIIGQKTNDFFDYLEDYRNAVEEYKEHYWKLNTFNHRVCLLEEEIFLTKAKFILDMLRTLRVKWISFFPKKKFIKYSGDIWDIVSWPKKPYLLEKYWGFFLN